MTMKKQTYFIKDLFDKKTIDEFLGTHGLTNYITPEKIIDRIMKQSRKWMEWGRDDYGFSIYCGSHNQHEIYIDATWDEERERLMVEICPVLYGVCVSNLDNDESWNKQIYYEILKDKRL